MNTYEICKKVIENQKIKNTLNKDLMADKLTIFLLGDRITGPEYNKLVKLLEEDGDVNVNA